MPEKIIQTTTGEKGNCFSACLASFIGIPITDVPNFFDLGSTDEEWHEAVKVWLADYNIGMITIRMWDDDVKNTKGFLLIGGTSPRGISHAVIYKDGSLWHDPHPESGGIDHAESADILYPLNPRLPFGRTPMCTDVDLDFVKSLRFIESEIIEAESLIGNYADVEDGDEEPKPNKAMKAQIHLNDAYRAIRLILSAIEKEQSK